MYVKSILSVTKKPNREYGMAAVKGRFLLFLFLLGIWLLLTLPFSYQEFGAGAFIALLIAVLPTGRSSGLSDFRLTPRSIYYSIVYLFVFLFALVKSNLDVAFRVVNPRLPINPGIVKGENAPEITDRPARACELDHADSGNDHRRDRRRGFLRPLDRCEVQAMWKKRPVRSFADSRSIWR